MVEAQRNEPYARARRMRNAGIALTVVGGTLGLVGIILGVSAAQAPEPRSFGEAFDQGLAKGYGFTFGIVGGALLIPGVVLWPLGESRTNEARRGSDARGVELVPAPAGSLGAGVGLRF